MIFKILASKYLLDLFFCLVWSKGAYNCLTRCSVPSIEFNCQDFKLKFSLFSICSLNNYLLKEKK